jgi:tRNA (guanine37-N1)-methyltransferase
VLQLGSIENEYRVFDMEVIAGEQAFETEVSQHGVRFRLDFSKVRR